MLVKPVTLEGPRVRLEPLTLGHLDALAEFGLNPELWRYRSETVGTPGEMRNYIQTILDRQAAGTEVGFATIERSSGRVAGSTRYMDIDVKNRSLEIGGTFIDPRWQRTFVNTEAKYLMLGYAFETWGCVRVSLKTDTLNERSQQAILRLGAREEGTLRNHMIMPGGRLRHSVYFSIIDSEWPAVKARLEAKLAGTGGPSV
ncbi:MAG: GNAT family N-acetyltransferase [Terriglobia bacterium]